MYARAVHTTLTPAPAAWLGWAWVSIVSALVWVWALPPGSAAAGRMVAFGAGAMLVAGFITAALVAVATRLAERRAGGHAPLILASLGALALGTFVLPPDVSIRASKLAGEDSPGPWVAALVIAISGGIPLAWLAGRRLRHTTSARALAALGTAAVVFMGDLVFPHAHEGVHLVLVVAAATAMGAALVGVPAGVLVRAPRWLRIAAPIGLLLAAAPSVLLRPGTEVLVALLQRPGAVFAPYLARAHLRRHAERSTRSGEWWSNRAERPPIAPTHPPLLDPASAVVVLVTVDALRIDVVDDPVLADRLPTFTRLREQARSFTRARTTAPATMVAFASLYSGKYFSQLRWSGEGDRALPTDDLSPRLPDVLGAGAVETVQITGSPFFAAEGGIVGRFSETIDVPTASGEHYAFAEPMIDAAIARLRRAAERPGEATFLAMHLMDAHAPYDRAGDGGGSIFEAYVGEVALVDMALGRLLAVLDEPSLRDRAIVIVTADHGESLGERNHYGHAVNLSEILVRVPFFVQGPGVVAGPDPTPISLVDLAPTVLDVFGQASPGAMMGQSLVPILRGEAVTLERPIAIDSGRRQQAMLFDDGFKAIVDARYGTFELYDLQRDPDERRNLASDAELGARADIYRETLEAFFAAHEYRAPGYEIPVRTP